MSTGVLKQLVLCRASMTADRVMSDVEEKGASLIVHLGDISVSLLHSQCHNKIHKDPDRFFSPATSCHFWTHHVTQNTLL